MFLTGEIISAPHGESYSMVEINSKSYHYQHSCELGSFVEFETELINNTIQLKSMYSSEILMKKYLRESIIIKVEADLHGKETLITKSNGHFFRTKIPSWFSQYITVNSITTVSLKKKKFKVALDLNRMVSSIFSLGQEYQFRIKEFNQGVLVGNHDGIDIKLRSPQGFDYKKSDQVISYRYHGLDKNDDLIFHSEIRFFLEPTLLLGNAYTEILRIGNYRIKGFEILKDQIQNSDNRWIISFFKFINDVIVNAFDRKDGEVFQIVTKIFEHNKYESIKKTFLAGFRKEKAEAINDQISKTLVLIEAAATLHKNNVDIINYEAFSNALPIEQELRIYRTICKEIGFEFFSLGQISRILERTRQNDGGDYNINGLIYHTLNNLSNTLSKASPVDLESRFNERKKLRDNTDVEIFINELLRYQLSQEPNGYDYYQTYQILSSLRLAFLLSRTKKYKLQEFCYPYENEIIDKDIREHLNQINIDFAILDNNILLNREGTAVYSNGKVLKYSEGHMPSKNVELASKEVIYNGSNLEVSQVLGVNYVGEEIGENVWAGIVCNKHDPAIYRSLTFAMLRQDDQRRETYKVTLSIKHLNNFYTNIPSDYFDLGDEIPLYIYTTDERQNLILDTNSALYKGMFNYNPPDNEYFVRATDNPIGKQEGCPRCKEIVIKAKDRTIYCTNKQCDFIFYPSIYLEDSSHNLYRLFYFQLINAKSIKKEGIIELRTNDLVRKKNKNDLDFSNYNLSFVYEPKKIHPRSFSNLKPYYDPVGRLLFECAIDDIIISHSKNPIEDLGSIYSTLHSPKSYLFKSIEKIEHLLSDSKIHTKIELKEELNSLIKTVEITENDFSHIRGLSNTLKELAPLFHAKLTSLELDMTLKRDVTWKTKALVSTYLISKEIYDEALSKKIIGDVRSIVLSYFMPQELALDKDRLETPVKFEEKTFLESIITEELPESENLEFKETFKCPVLSLTHKKEIDSLRERLKSVKEEQRNGIMSKIDSIKNIPIHDKEKQKTVMFSTIKNICAMINKVGGNIIIGLRDNKDEGIEAVGLSADYQLTGGWDDLELSFHQSLSNFIIDFEYWQNLIMVEKQTFDDKDFMVIKINRVERGEKRLCFINKNNVEMAFVKNGSSSISLTPSKIRNYSRPKPSQDSEPCYVYVVKNGRNQAKIGISIDPTTRMGTLSPDNIDLRDPICFKFKNKTIAHDIEKSLHAKYDKFRIGNSEFFDLDLEHFDNVINDLRNQINSVEAELT